MNVVSLLNCQNKYKRKHATHIYSGDGFLSHCENLIFLSFFYIIIFVGFFLLSRRYNFEYIFVFYFDIMISYSGLQMPTKEFVL